MNGFETSGEDSLVTWFANSQMFMLTDLYEQYEQESGQNVSCAVIQAPSTLPPTDIAEDTLPPTDVTEYVDTDNLPPIDITSTLQPTSQVLSMAAASITDMVH